MKAHFERWAAVAQNLDDRLVICGGKSRSGGRHQDCTVIEDGKSNKELYMLEKRYGASSMAVNETTMWIVGKPFSAEKSCSKSCSKLARLARKFGC